MFDRDGDGLISEEELRLTMNNLGEPLTEAEVKSMIAEADLDGDGKINFQVNFSKMSSTNILFFLTQKLLFVNEEPILYDFRIWGPLRLGLAVFSFHDIQIHYNMTIASLIL